VTRAGAPDPPSIPASPDEAALRAASWMDGFGAPWCVAGGWAVDLFLGRRTRPHADLDLVILRGDEHRLHGHLAGWTLQLAVDGVLHPWAPGERIPPSVHAIWAHSPDGDRLELLVNEHAGTEWVYRRDPAVRCPLAKVVTRSAAGVPVLCPAVVLLYKSRAPREADEHDFELLLPALPTRQRRWLRSALAAAHPEHPWEARL
jgi:hypothetical protein